MKKIFLFTTVLCLILSTTIYAKVPFTGKYTCKDRPNCYILIKRFSDSEGIITYYDGNTDVSMEGRIESQYKPGDRTITVYWSTGLVETLELVNAIQFYAGDFLWRRTEIIE